MRAKLEVTPRWFSSRSCFCAWLPFTGQWGTFTSHTLELFNNIRSFRISPLSWAPSQESSSIIGILWTPSSGPKQQQTSFLKCEVKTVFFLTKYILIVGYLPAVFRYHFLHYDMPTSGIFKAPTLSNNFLFMQVQFEEKLPFFIEICDLLQVCYWKLGRNCNDVRPVFQIVQKRFY